MPTRKFPILTRGGTKAPCPSWIPWEVIEPYEGHAQENHQQTLERLAERGGLDPVEAYFVLTGRRWNNVPTPVSEELEREACRHLDTLVREGQVARLTYELDHERAQKEMRHSAWLEGQAEIGRLKADRDGWRESYIKADAEVRIEARRHEDCKKALALACKAGKVDFAGREAAELQVRSAREECAKIVDSFDTADWSDTQRNVVRIIALRIREGLPENPDGVERVCPDCWGDGSNPFGVFKRDTCEKCNGTGKA